MPIVYIVSRALSRLCHLSAIMRIAIKFSGWGRRPRKRRDCASEAESWLEKSNALRWRPTPDRAGWRRPERGGLGPRRLYERPRFVLVAVLVISVILLARPASVQHAFQLRPLTTISPKKEKKNRKP